MFQRDAAARLTLAEMTKKEAGMESNYVFLCGVMWCKFGQRDAGNELLRAADSGDPDIKALARAMFAKGLPRSRDWGKQAQPSGGTMVAGELWG